MTNNEERMKILKMIEAGKISAEDGAKLLAALEESYNASSDPYAHGKSRKSGTARILRIRVTDIKSGRSKVSVQIPLALVDAGLKIGAHFAPDVAGVDMSNVMDAMRSGVTGKIIDVTNDEIGEHVEIFIE
ncbi:MAG: hypothetical protein QGM50_01530 [Anaerolineae bacterium]|nr:hypothetical protein [Anaerolineae bacterium]